MNGDENILEALRVATRPGPRAHKTVEPERKGPYERRRECPKHPGEYQFTGTYECKICRKERRG